MESTYLFVSLVGLYTAAAAMIDLRTKRIPNYLTMPAALLGLAYHSFAPAGWGIGTSLAGLGVGLALLLLPWLLGGGGMGDVKLLGALGAWLGPRLMLIAFGTSVLFAAIGAALILASMIVTQGMVKTKNKHLQIGGTKNQKKKNQKPPSRRRMLPFAVPVAISTWCVLAWIVTRGAL